METGGKFVIEIVVEMDPDHLFIPSESGTGKVVFEPGVMMQELKNLKLLLFDRFQAQEIMQSVDTMLQQRVVVLFFAFVRVFVVFFWWWRLFWAANCPDTILFEYQSFVLTRESSFA